MALITSAILYLVAAALLLLTATEVQIADFDSRSMQALYAAESSVTLGVSRLRHNSNFRTTTNEAIMIDRRPVLLTVSFTPQVFDNVTSLYRLSLRGTGAVTGTEVSTVRHVEQQVTLKPFVLLARNRLTIGDNCRVTGNVHANGPVLLGPASHIEGNVSSAVSVAVTDAGVDAASVVSDGDVAEQEPVLTVPALDLTQYYPTYWYDGKPGTAQPLTSDTIPLQGAAPGQFPADEIVVYSGIATPENPAGVFYPETPLTDPLAAIDLHGTLIIPPNYGAASLQMSGPIRITPFGSFPAIISANPIDLTLMSGQSLKQYAKTLNDSHIAGLLYCDGDVTIAGRNTGGEFVTGAIIGSSLSISTDIIFRLAYEPALFRSPPPGIEFIEFGEWREPFSW